MLRFPLGVTGDDMIQNKHNKKDFGDKERLKWFGHVLRRDSG